MCHPHLYPPPLCTFPSALIKVKIGIAREPRSILRRKKTFTYILHELEAFSGW